MITTNQIARYDTAVIDPKAVLIVCDKEEAIAFAKAIIREAVNSARKKW